MCQFITTFTLVNPAIIGRVGARIIAMHRQYRTLELPSTASADDVKIQYERLVRIYDPDQFKDARDREFAARKRAEVEEAYAALTTGVENDERHDPPKPVVTPGHISFGLVPAGECRSAKVIVDNRGGEVQVLTVTPGEETAWYQVGSAMRLSAATAFPVQVDVSIDTATLPPNWTHMGWVDVTMDSAVARISLDVEVTKQRRPVMASAWTVVGVLLIALLAAGWMSVPTLSAMPDNLDRLFASSPPLSKALDNHFLLAAKEDGTPMLHVVGLDGRLDKSLDIGGSQPDIARTTGAIAFVATKGGHQQVHVIGARNNATRQITHDASDKTLPRWSPDGEHIAFLAQDDDQSHLRIVSGSGATVTSLHHEGLKAIQSFAWSPDGRRIAVGAIADRGPRVWVFEPWEDKNAELVGFDTWDPVWSPNGEELAIASDRGVYLVSPDGRDLRRLNVQPAHSPVWSPEGNQIAFLSTWHDPENAMQMWVVDESSGKTELLTAEEYVLGITWLPHNQGIAYVITENGGESGVPELWVRSSVGERRFVAELADPAIAWLDFD